MKCSNCINILIISLRCPHCPNLFCSLSCLESHYANYHNLNLFHKNSSQNNIYFHHATRINSIFLVKGILNSEINYNPIYNLNNFIPVYQSEGKLKIIGSGSYGQVYLGQNIIDRKYYAIKHMNKKQIFEILNSFLNIQKEIEIQSKIDHPNIIKLLYVKETETSYDLIMEYAQGGNLFHYIRDNKSLSESQSFGIFIQVVNAITFLHQNDLIHRDIKPENILIFENNEVKLCDFGWCVKLNGYQRDTFCGTTEYMSPELINHQGYGKEIDTWSLGVLLYEMIHGYSPFKPNKNEFEPEDVMINIINHNLKFKDQISERCKKLIYGLLDSNINNRYTVEDIFNSEFVKYYENLEKNKIKYNNYNDIYTGERKNNFNRNRFYSPQIEMNNNINIHMSMDYNNYIYNIEIPERNNSYDFVKDNETEQKNNKPINKGLYENYVNNANNNHNYLFNNSCYNLNYNINNSSIDDIINFNNKSFNGNERQYKQKILSPNKIENNFDLNDYINQEEQQKILNSYSSNKENINNYYNNLEKDSNNKRKGKENINSSLKYFYEAKNYINNNNNHNFLNNNIDDSNHILKISYLSNSQINNDEKESIKNEPSDKVLNKNYSGNYIFNNYKRTNHSKFKLIKRTPLNNKSIDFNTNLSLSSFQTPEKNFSNIKRENIDSLSIINNNIFVPDLEIKNKNYKSYIKIPENRRFFIESHNNNNMSKSEISNLTEIEAIKKKEPTDNTKKKRNVLIKNINIVNKNSNNNILIKNYQKNNCNKESSKSNINIYKNISFDKPKDIILTESMNSKNNYNLPQQNIQTEKDEIPNNILTDIYKKNNKSIDNHHIDKDLIIRHMHKPKNFKIEGKNEINYKKHIKNNINNIKEPSNLYYSTNLNFFCANEPKKDNIENHLKYNEGKININSPHSFITNIRKNNLINKIEEKRPKNNKNSNSKGKSKSPKSINYILNNDKKVIKFGENKLLNSYSDNYIVKITKINKSSNDNLNDKNIKNNRHNKNDINNKYYTKNKYKEKGKSDIIKKRIKKIYIYNNQIKNLNEQDKNKNTNIDKLNKSEKEKIEDKPIDNRNKNNGSINCKNKINVIKKKEFNINNNLSHLKDVNDDRNKTPEKKSIFNPVKPNFLIESFKKELETKTNMLKIRYNPIKK